jgi:hypothetical protein
MMTQLTEAQALLCEICNRTDCTDCSRLNINHETGNMVYVHYPSCTVLAQRVVVTTRYCIQ